MHPEGGGNQGSVGNVAGKQGWIKMLKVKQRKEHDESHPSTIARNSKWVHRHELERLCTWPPARVW